jgi:hypothetical protein
LLAVKKGFWLLLIINIDRINSIQVNLTVVLLKIYVKLWMALKIVDFSGKPIKSSINKHYATKE